MPKAADRQEPAFWPKLWQLLWDKKPAPVPTESYRLTDDGKICAVISYFKGRGITNKTEAEAYGEKLYEAYVNNMLYIHVPDPRH